MVSIKCDICKHAEIPPFGMVMPNRSWVAASAEGYRFGFNTQEKNEEVYGNGNLYSAEFWQYNPRLGRRWNIDYWSYSFESPYSVLGNNPVLNIDILGNKWKNPADDGSIANEIISSIDQRIQTLNSKAAKYEEKASKYAYKGKLEKANKQLSKADELRQGAVELNNSKIEIIEMGNRNDFTFTFKENIGVNYSSTSRDEDGTIVIEFSDHANAIHELTHAYQHLTGQIYLIAGMNGILYGDLSDEQQAYRRQYFFYPLSVSSLNSSYKMKIKSSQDIIYLWIAKIWVPHNGKATFLYSKHGAETLNVPESEADLKSRKHEK